MIALDWPLKESSVTKVRCSDALTTKIQNTKMQKYKIQNTKKGVFCDQGEPRLRCFNNQNTDEHFLFQTIVTIQTIQNTKYKSTKIQNTKMDWPLKESSATKVRCSDALTTKIPMKIPSFNGLIRFYHQYIYLY